jgi:F0F1-type ATP synthase assembly protein I
MDSPEFRPPTPNTDTETRDDGMVSITRQYAHYATAGIMFPVAIALGFFGGYYVDQWFGTVPLFALVGLGLGFTAALRNLLQTAASDENVR